MPVYLFMRGALAWTALVALFPLSAIWSAYAYRIWRSNKLDEEEAEELWTRAVLAWGAVAGAAALGVLLDYILADWAALPAGPVHLVVYLALVALAVWLLMLFFAIEDFFGALSLLLIYLYLPTFLFWLVNAVTGLLNPVLNYLYDGWLVKP